MYTHQLHIPHLHSLSNVRSTDSLSRRPKSSLRQRLTGDASSCSKNGEGIAQQIRSKDLQTDGVYRSRADVGAYLSPPSYQFSKQRLGKTERSLSKTNQYFISENRPKTHKSIFKGDEDDEKISKNYLSPNKISALIIPKSTTQSVSCTNSFEQKHKERMKDRIYSEDPQYKVQTFQKSTEKYKKYSKDEDLNEIQRKIKQTEEMIRKIKGQHQNNNRNKKMIDQDQRNKVISSQKNLSKEKQSVISGKESYKICVNGAENLRENEKSKNKSISKLLGKPNNSCANFRTLGIGQIGKERKMSAQIQNTFKQQFVLYEKKKQPLNVVLQDFIIKESLGSGQFGNVYKVYHIKTGSIYALKKIEKQKLIHYQLIDQFIKEVKIQSFINHKNSASCYGIFDDKQHIYMVLEFFQEGSLYSKIKKLHKNKLNKIEEDEQNNLRSYIKQICEALAFVHRNGIYHRDIKPQNILFVNENVCKLADFGCATTFTLSEQGEEERRHTLCGTFDYSAPQILGTNVQYDHAVDLWGMGVLAYEILVGKTPFYEISKKQTAYKIIHTEDDKLDFPKNMSDLSIDFISKILKKAPKERMNCEQMLRHPFLKDLPDEY